MNKVKIYGITCERTMETMGDGKRHACYSFEVPGWDRVTICGKRDAERVIRGRLDSAVRNTMGISC